VRAPKAQDECVTIAGRTSDPAGPYAAPRAWSVFNNDGLTENFPHPLSKNAPNHIRRPAWSERYDHRDWPRWIGLRACNARHCGKRYSACDEMQKLSAGEHHFCHLLFPE
jgi:hypothetical protein